MCSSDLTDFEARGVPAAAICTEPFLASASAMAARRGFPGYVFARVAHPVSSLDQLEIEERAREALPQVLTILGIDALRAAARREALVAGFDEVAR